MKYLVHTEFPPVNLELVTYVQRTSSNKIVFFFGGGSSIEWDFKTEDLRNKYYLQITELVLEKEGEMLV